MFNESAIDILCDPDTHDPIAQQAGSLVNANGAGREDLLRAAAVSEAILQIARDRGQASDRSGAERNVGGPRRGRVRRAGLHAQLSLTVQRVTVLSLELRLAGSGAAASSCSAAETSASYRFREIGGLMACPRKRMS